MLAKITTSSPITYYVNITLVIGIYTFGQLTDYSGIYMSVRTESKINLALIYLIVWSRRYISQMMSNSGRAECLPPPSEICHITIPHFHRTSWVVLYAMLFFPRDMYHNS